MRLSRPVLAGLVVGGATLLPIAAIAARSPVPAPAAVAATSPADGARLAGAPTEIDLTFTAAVDPGLSHVLVRDGSGAAIERGPARLVRPVLLRQPIGPAAGEVTVAYHVTFTNGTDLSGTLRFVVTGGAPAGRAATDGETSAHRHGIDPVNAALLALDAAVVLVVGVLLLVRPRPRRP